MTCFIVDVLLPQRQNKEPSIAKLHDWRGLGYLLASKRLHQTSVNADTHGADDCCPQSLLVTAVRIPAWASRIEDEDCMIQCVHNIVTEL